MSFMKNEEKANEALQIAYIKIANNLYQLEDERTFYKWVNTIVANTCKDQLKKRNEFSFSDYEGYNDNDDISIDIEDEHREYKPDESTKYEDDRDVVIGFINELPTEQRTALIMQIYDDKKISEIAEFFDTNENTIKSRLNYAKKSLKEKIEAYYKATGSTLFSGSMALNLKGFYESYERSVVVKKDVYAGISKEISQTLASISSPEVEAMKASTENIVEDTTKKVTKQSTETIKDASKKVVKEVVEETIEQESRKSLIGLIIGLPAKVKIASLAVVLLLGGGGIAVFNNKSTTVTPANLDAIDEQYIEYLVDSLTYDGSDTDFYENFTNNVVNNEGSLLSLDTIKAIRETGNDDDLVYYELENCEALSDEYISSSIGSVTSTEEVDQQEIPSNMDSDIVIAQTENEDEYRVYITREDCEYVDVLIKREQDSFFGYTVLEYTVDNQKKVFDDFSITLASSKSDISNISSEDDAGQYAFESDGYGQIYEDIENNEEDDRTITISNQGDTDDYGYYYLVEIEWETYDVYKYYVFVESGKVICIDDNSGINNVSVLASQY